VNHTTLAMVVVLATALVTGMSLALPLQDAKASSEHHKKHGSISIKNNENQANTCSGDLVECVNLLTNIDCIHATCIIGDPQPTVSTLHA
jgi:hypothetical protein